MKITRSSRSGAGCPGSGGGMGSTWCCSRSWSRDRGTHRHTALSHLLTAHRSFLLQGFKHQQTLMRTANRENWAAEKAALQAVFFHGFFMEYTGLALSHASGADSSSATPLPSGFRNGKVSLLLLRSVTSSFKHKNPQLEHKSGSPCPPRPHPTSPPRRGGTDMLMNICYV